MLLRYPVACWMSEDKLRTILVTLSVYANIMQSIAQHFLVIQTRNLTKFQLLIWRIQFLALS